MQADHNILAELRVAAGLLVPQSFPPGGDLVASYCLRLSRTCCSSASSSFAFV